MYFLYFSGRFRLKPIPDGHLHFGTEKAQFVPISAQLSAFSAISRRWRATFTSPEGPLP
jgi:hypothetical protein